MRFSTAEDIIKAALPVLIVSTFAAIVGKNSELWGADETTNAATQYPNIEAIDPPEQEFFTKVLSFKGILIKAPAVVVDEALYRAYDRISRETAHLPMVVSNLAAAGAELHIIGRNQVTTDLPEWRHDKHIPLDEYNGLTRDQRTRGMGGLITSCGEENVLNLPTDRYRGNDICMHEFAHNIEGSGMGPDIRARFNAQSQRSKELGLWLGSYAGSNPNEYFSELTVWYFGSHGSRAGLQGVQPEDGTEGLKKYDPEAFALFDEFYSGKMDVPKLEPRFPRSARGTNAAPTRQRTPRDSLVARAIVANLTSYKVGETTLNQFFSDSGMSAPTDRGANGWYVVQREIADASTPVEADAYKFNVQFQNPAGGGRRGGSRGGGGAVSTNSTPTLANTPVSRTGTNALITNSGNPFPTNMVVSLVGTNALVINDSTIATPYSNAIAVSSSGTNVITRGGGRGGRGGAGGRLPNLADLDFKGGVLTAFKWNN